jgi:hypothetical protein
MENWNKRKKEKEMKKDLMRTNLINYFEIYSPLRAVFNNICRWLPETSISAIELNNLLLEAFKYCDHKYTEADAIAWADGFVIPPDIVLKDTSELANSGGDFESFIRTRQNSLRPGRLNHDRLNRWRERDTRQMKRLREMVDGFRVPTPTGFINQSISPPLREKYKRVSNAVNKMFYALAKQELVVILPDSVAKNIKGIHYSPANWVEKYNKPSGRPVVDSSWSNDPSITPPLNTKEVTDKVEEM